MIYVPKNRIDADLAAVLHIDDNIDSKTESKDTKNGEDDDRPIEIRFELIRITPVDSNSYRTITLRINDINFSVKIADKDAGKAEGFSGIKADPEDKNQIAAPIPGIISEINTSVGAQVEKGQNIAKITAMKMDLRIQAPFAGKIADVGLRVGDKILAGTLIFVIQPKIKQ